MELTKQNQQLARDTLRLTREKFELGVTTTVEVTQAESGRFASSDLDYITSLFRTQPGEAESRAGNG